MFKLIAKKVGLGILKHLITKPTKGDQRQEPGTMEPPSADPELPVPVVWGTCKVQPNVMWWGDAMSQEFSFRGVFDGYQYFSGVAMVLCWGGSQGSR